MDHGSLKFCQYSILVFIIIAVNLKLSSAGEIGSCDFEDGHNALCGYEQYSYPDENAFDWSLDELNGNNRMQVLTAHHVQGEKAKLISPTIEQQDTHCYSFRYLIESLPSLSSSAINISSNSHGPTSQLNVYVLDHDSGVQLMPVWSSDFDKPGSAEGWKRVELALNPLAYQVIFEAVILYQGPGSLEIDDITVQPSACSHSAHFLRLGSKEVNLGSSVDLKCLLWGHDGVETIVSLQKSSGEMLLPSQKQQFGDHLSAVFKFDKISLLDRGMYRCVTGNISQVGVSNYASLSVRVPPVPILSPRVIKPGSTNLVIALNADNYTGDGPVVQTILNYRSVDGKWSDVHHITTSDYHLWHLKPDTEYVLAVTLKRSGVNGTGSPGPELRSKTKCGTPIRPVQKVNFKPLGSDRLRVVWDTPDFSVTQCNYYTYRVLYRKSPDGLQSDDVTSNPYSYEEIQNRNAAITLQGLDPFTNYEVKVELSNSAGSIQTGSYTVRTGEGVPGPVPIESFITKYANESMISLEWAEPVTKNGKLLGYEISYQAIRSHDPSFSLDKENAHIERAVDDRGINLRQLRPGTTFLIGLRAETGAGLGEKIEMEVSTDIAAPVMPEYPDPASANTSITDTTVEILLIPAHTNGAPVTNYYVIIEDVTPEPYVTSPPSIMRSRKRGGKRRRGSKNGVRKVRSKRQAVIAVEGALPTACHEKPSSFDDARAANKTTYAGAKFPSDQLKTEMKFVVGQGGSVNGFENPPLDPNRQYNIYIRAESEVEGETKVSCVLVAHKAAIVTTTTTTTTTTSASTTPTTTESPVLNESSKPMADGRTGQESNNNGTAEVVPEIKDPEEDKEQTMLYAAVGGVAGACLIILLIVIFIVLKLRRRKKSSSRKDEVVNPFEVRMMLTDMNSPSHTFLPQQSNGTAERQTLMPDVVGYEHQDVDKGSDHGGGSAYSTTLRNNERYAVRVDDFHVHVSQMKQSDCYGFREEFAIFADGATAPWSVGESAQNRVKNRYGNVIAYDHSRVILDAPAGYEDEFSSDYINASYINGYKNPSTYIATQAPIADTVDDFWLMVWQERSSVIIMVANLVEMGKRKCHKYWPDDREVFGSLEVSLNSQERTSDYIVRTFLLQQAGSFDVREVKQFHFTAWPDHGVPSNPTNLLTFVRKVKAYEPPEGPAVVHCSAGSGRTGCYIAVDMMLDMAREEEIVDIYNTVRDLRTRRVDMVQTDEQYIFIHEAILEALLCGETAVDADRLGHHYDDLITVDPSTHLAPIQEEFETLNVITPKLLDEECSVARLPRNRALNRFKDVLPSDRHLAYLVTPDPSDRESNYINAVYVDSYSKRNAFLVTQMPLPSTVLDIWRLAYDHNCTSIVMMNDQSEHDQTCSVYWPETGMAGFGPFTVETIHKEDEVDVFSRVFRLQNTSKPGEKTRLVRHFQLTNWPAAQPVPYSRNAVLRVIQLVMKWQEECTRNGERGRTLVHCVAGAGRSGTFVACYNMCEQMRNEYAVDVFNVVQRLRNVRPQLVETLEQYRFCYEVGIEFADQ